MVVSPKIKKPAAGRNVKRSVASALKAATVLGQAVDLGDKARAILLSCANNLTFYAGMAWTQPTDGNRQDAG